MESVVLFGSDDDVTADWKAVSAVDSAFILVAKSAFGAPDRMATMSVFTALAALSRAVNLALLAAYHTATAVGGIGLGTVVTGGATVGFVVTGGAVVVVRGTVVGGNVVVGTVVAGTFFAGTVFGGATFGECAVVVEAENRSL